MGVVTLTGDDSVILPVTAPQLKNTLEEQSPPLEQQIAVAASFGVAMVAGNLFNAQNISILSSDLFSMSVKNALRLKEGLQGKVQILGAGTLTSYFIDLYCKAKGITSLDLTSLSVGIGIKTLDRELNLFLKGVSKNSEGEKIKEERSTEAIATLVAVTALVAFASSGLGTAPVLTDAALTALATAFKHLTKRESSPHATIMGLGSVTAASIAWDALVNASIIPVNVKVSKLMISLFIKYVISKAEGWQLGDFAEMVDEDSEEIQGKKPPQAKKEKKLDRKQKEAKTEYTNPDDIEANDSEKKALKKAKKVAKKQEKKGEQKQLVLPAPMWQQAVATAGLATATCASQIAFGGSIVSAGLGKWTSRFSRNILSQYALKEAAGMAGQAAIVLGSVGGVAMQMGGTVAEVGEVVAGFGLGLPMTVLKNWQLGKTKPITSGVVIEA